MTHPSAVCAQAEYSALIKKAIPSIVVVNVFNKEGKWRGSGTGFFVKEEGLLVTNHHVIDGRARAVVKLSNGEFLPVRGLLSEDIIGDLAILVLEDKGISFPTLDITDREVESGQPIAVIGNPLGHERIVSKGIVSEVRNVPDVGKIILHTAPISAGSSGSPVLNMQGEVIGVVVGHVEGQDRNFAISADRVKSLLSSAQAKPRELLELVNRDELKWLELLLNGRSEELINSLKWRIRINPRNSMAHFYLGKAFARLSRNDEAIKSYKEAIRLEPESSNLYYSLGVSYIRLGNYNEAIQAFRKAVRIEPGDADAFLNLGYSYGELGRQKEAIEAYKEAIRIKPDFAQAHYNLGEIYLKTKRRNMSIEQYRILENLNSELADELFELIHSGIQR
ncbi:MAG: tetratricopeptide repeat protein [Candidatus Methanomethylicus sp.]|nr:tetratricopeptide repeat protein [Candidatus Methanomethylicus sp.]